MVSVNKGNWDKALSVKDKHEFNKKWIRECYRVIKDEGTIWISGTLHNIYSIGMALEEEGFKIINNITWLRKIPLYYTTEIAFCQAKIPPKAGGI